MNLPGINTCVCDASVAKDADARVSQICPRLEGRRMSPIGTTLTFRNVCCSVAIGVKADIERVSFSKSDL
jgi:hypothetical protein